VAEARLSQTRTAVKPVPAWLDLLRDEVVIRLRLHGITQRQLAAHVGLSEKYLSQLLTGCATGSPYLIDKIARAMGLEIDVVSTGLPDNELRGRVYLCLNRRWPASSCTWCRR
jgi:transcriptional regulator with XRE-family HTH domain